MSEQLEQLERGYRLMWREGRPAEAASGLLDEFEWVVPGHPEGDVHHGADGLLKFFQEWTEPWEGLEVDWELQQSAPDRVLAKIEMRGRGRGSGAPAEMHFFQIWTFRGDEPVRMEIYWDDAEARSAAGLDS